MLLIQEAIRSLKLMLSWASLSLSGLFKMTIYNRACKRLVYILPRSPISDPLSNFPCSVAQSTAFFFSLHSFPTDKTMSVATATAATAAVLSHHPTTKSTTLHHYQLPPSFKPKISRPITRLHVSSSTNKTPSTAAESGPKPTKETIFFDGGAHYGDLVANLLFGFTLVWLPLTIAAVSRAFFLRYRFTDLRVTVISGFTGEDRSDFSYIVVKDVQVVPRFIGEWGDVIITLSDGTKVDLRSVPRFREIAKYCLAMAEKPLIVKESGAKGF